MNLKVNLKTNLKQRIQLEQEEFDALEENYAFSRMKKSEEELDSQLADETTSEKTKKGMPRPRPAETSA